MSSRCHVSAGVMLEAMRVLRSGSEMEVTMGLCVCSSCTDGSAVIIQQGVVDLCRK